MDRVENMQEGVYYFGFATCLWCKELLPVLHEVLIENKTQAYVIDTKDSNFINKNEAVVRKLFVKFTNKKDFVIPFILRINKEGQVTTHIGTVDNHNAKISKMTNNQKKLLYKTLDKLIHN